MSFKGYPNDPTVEKGQCFNDQTQTDQIKRELREIKLRKQALDDEFVQEKRFQQLVEQNREFLTPLVSKLTNEHVKLSQRVQIDQKKMIEREKVEINERFEQFLKEKIDEQIRREREEIRIKSDQNEQLLQTLHQQIVDKITHERNEMAKKMAEEQKEISQVENELQREREEDMIKRKIAQLQLKKQLLMQVVERMNKHRAIMNAQLAEEKCLNAANAELFEKERNFLAEIKKIQQNDAKLYLENYKTLESTL